jgi:hypothetical protein
MTKPTNRTEPAAAARGLPAPLESSQNRVGD